MRHVPDKSRRLNQNIHYTFNDLLSKSCCLLDNVENYRRAGQATDDNMAHAHCTLDAYGHRTSSPKATNTHPQ